MMNTDDVPRGIPYPQGRKPVLPNTRYSSPSPSYNYNYNTNSGYASQQHMRRKIDNRFKRDNGNGNDRVMRQNDLIIKLLKEIRDRLPPPPVSPAAVSSEAATVRPNGLAKETEGPEASSPGQQTPTADTGGTGASVVPESDAVRQEQQRVTDNPGDAE